GDRRREGPSGPTSAGPTAAAAPCWGARPQAKTPGASGLVLLVALRYLPPAPLLHCAVRWQTHIGKTARPLTTLGGVEPPIAFISAPTHALPHINAAQLADGRRATRCSLRRCEAWLLADCWQRLGRPDAAPQYCRSNRRLTSRSHPGPPRSAARTGRHRSGGCY